MCMYCERKTKSGWNQPPLCDENWEHPTDTIKNSISSNLNINGEPDWEARIHDYQSCTPELIVTSKAIAAALWGDGIASIYIPIKFCPVCGRKLGKEQGKPTEEYVIRYGGQPLDSSNCTDSMTKEDAEMFYDKLTLNTLITWKQLLYRPLSDAERQDLLKSDSVKIVDKGICKVAVPGTKD